MTRWGRTRQELTKQTYIIKSFVIGGACSDSSFPSAHSGRDRASSHENLKRYNLQHVPSPHASQAVERNREDGLYSPRSRSSHAIAANDRSSKKKYMHFK
jgi:hypothetical protein